MRSLLIPATFLMTATSVLAMDSFEFAESLGNIIAAEEFCELSSDQKAIETKVSADDLDFAGYLDTVIFNKLSELDGISGARKTAFCTQVRRTAVHYQLEQ